jgi:hypothetical protein
MSKDTEYIINLLSTEKNGISFALFFEHLMFLHGMTKDTPEYMEIQTRQIKIYLKGGVK